MYRYILVIDIHNVAVLELHHVYFGDKNAATGYFYKSKKGIRNNS